MACAVYGGASETGSSSNGTSSKQVLSSNCVSHAQNEDEKLLKPKLTKKEQFKADDAVLTQLCYTPTQLRCVFYLLAAIQQETLPRVCNKLVILLVQLF